MATRLHAGQLRNQVSIPSRGKSSLVHSIQTSYEAHTAYNTIGAKSHLPSDEVARA
jgi:hypothetical protein